MLFPKLKKKVATSSNGVTFVIIERHWLGRVKPLFKIPVEIQFWPREMIPTVPTGMAIPKRMDPTIEESRSVATLQETAGWKVIRKFWSRDALMIHYRMVGAREDILTMARAQGEFDGFMMARQTVERLARWGDDAFTGDFDDGADSQDEFYDNMREANKEFTGGGSLF